MFVNILLYASLRNNGEEKDIEEPLLDKAIVIDTHTIEEASEFNDFDSEKEDIKINQIANSTVFSLINI